MLALNLTARLTGSLRIETTEVTTPNRLLRTSHPSSLPDQSVLAGDQPSACIFPDYVEYTTCLFMRFTTCLSLFALFRSQPACFFGRPSLAAYPVHHRPIIWLDNLEYLTPTERRLFNTMHWALYAASANYLRSQTVSNRK